VLVIGMMAVLALIGLTAVSVSSAGLRSATDTADSRRAAAVALSAIEVGLDDLRSLDRAAAIGSLPAQVQESVQGQYSYEIVDPADGDLGDDPSDPAEITGIGESGRARWAETATAVDDPGLPIEPLGATMSVRDRLTIGSGATVTARGAPVSTDAEMVLEGTIDGDAEAGSSRGSGTVTGTFEVPSNLRGIARREVFDEWAARATDLGFSGDMAGHILAPGVNSYNSSGTNEHGIYVIRTGGADIEIRRSRVLGTLLIDASDGGTVTLRDEMLIEPARPDAPALMIKGEVVLDTSSNDVSESVRSLNPPGAPYRGVEDLDLDDDMPSVIRGLVYVFGHLTLEGDGIYRGSILVDGGAAVFGDPVIAHDRMLILSPPLGFGDNQTVGDMRLLPLSHRRVPLP